MYIELPCAVKLVLEKLNNAGYEAYVVGGCVRDSLMGMAPYDWDIATSATPREMQAVFADHRTIETGLKHGTLAVVIEDIPMEITTFRVEGYYSDGRHPDQVVFSRNVTEDLKRRDFTINAMAYHPISGVIDLFNGKSDVDRGILRCVGDPQKRFEEDALRILRALRFASALDFVIEEKTAAALHRLFPALQCVSRERIAAELCKLLCGKAAQRIAVEYVDVLSFLLPPLCKATDFHLLSAVAPSPAYRLAALFWQSDVSIETLSLIMRELRLDNHTVRSVLLLHSCREMPHTEQRQWLRILNRLDAELTWVYLALCEADETVYELLKNLLNNRCCYKMSMLAVNGNDLMQAGLCEGPMVGQLLQTLLEAVMDGLCLNQTDALLSYAKAMKKPVL